VLAGGTITLKTRKAILKGKKVRAGNQGGEEQGVVMNHSKASQKEEDITREPHEFWAKSKGESKLDTKY